MTRAHTIAVSTVLGALAGAAALVLACAAQPVIVLDMDGELSTLARGFYPVERAPGGLTFAWTTARAELRLPGLDRRAPWVAVVRLRGARPDPAQLPDVQLAADGVVLRTVRTTNDFQDVTIEIPARLGDRGLVLGVIPSSTFVPGPGDARALGVMVDEMRVSPAAGTVALPPRRALGSATIAAGTFGAALAAIGVTAAAAVSASVVIALAQAAAISRGLGPYEAYGGDLAYFALVVALLLAGGVWIAERATGRTFRNTARFAAAFSAAVLYLRLAALLHPAMPVGDALSHAHHLEWVLSGQWLFTTATALGIQVPQPIALYVLAAPFTLVVHGLPAYVDLLRTIAAVADALAGLLAYLVIVRATGDRLAGAVACGLYHLVPVNYAVQAAGQLTGAFAQAAGFAAIALVALGTARAGARRGLAAGVAAATVAVLSDAGSAALMPAVLAILALLLARMGGRAPRGSARAAASMAALALMAAVAFYQGSIVAACREAAAQVDAWAFGTRLLHACGGLLASCGTPALVLAGAGTAWLVRRRQRDRLGLVLLGWTSAIAAAVGMLVLTSVDPGPYLAFFPALAMTGGLGAAWMWRRGGWWQALAATLLAWVAARGAWDWWRPLLSPGP